MLGHYGTAALRVLTRSRTYAFVNIAGLAVGLAACLMILLHVRHELSYDHWLPDSERVYQLQTKLIIGPLKQEELFQASPYGAGVALAKDFPQVEKRVHAQMAFPTIVRGGIERSATALMLVDGPFFEVLALPLVQGDARTTLARPGSIVLTQSEATRLFGSDRAFGEVLTLKFDEASYDFKVTGIIEDLPTNTHLGVTALARIDPATPPPYAVFDESQWGHFAGYTYLKLRRDADADAIRAGMPAWHKRTVPQRLGLGEYQFRLVNVGEVHLGEAPSMVGSRPNIDRGFIATFGVVALLILAMACINFTNLATARATRRAREIALRKLVGASRRQLVGQFLAEALLFTTIAMVLALAIVELLLPGLSRFLDADLSLPYADPGLGLPLVALTLLVGIASGLYPALYLSRFRPAQVLKANASASEAPASARVRTLLVVAQFAISIGLIACTAIVYRQTAFARSVDPGYHRTGLMQIANAGELRESAEAFAHELARIPGVTAVSRTGLRIGFGGFMIVDLTEPGMTEPLKVEGATVAPGLFETMGIRLLAGRDFNARRPADESGLPPGSGPESGSDLAARDTNVVINERAVRRLGFKTPAEALGKTLDFNFRGGRTSTVIGVVQDSRFGSVRDEIRPAVFFYDRSQLPSLVLRYEGANPLLVRRTVEAIWDRMAPHVPIQAEFAEDVIQRLYEAEEARGTLFAAFALVAVVIACLGLFGLAAFSAERRTKEIGVRKVFGATVPDIVRLLVWQFSKPVLIANLIAWPVAWWVMREWLNGFDARIALTPAPFLLAGLLALAIAAATVGAHAVRMARGKPADALRYE